MHKYIWLIWKHKINIQTWVQYTNTRISYKYKLKTQANIEIWVLYIIIRIIYKRKININIYEGYIKEKTNK